MSLTALHVLSVPSPPGFQYFGNVERQIESLIICATSRGVDPRSISIHRELGVVAAERIVRDLARQCRPQKQVALTFVGHGLRCVPPHAPGGEPREHWVCQDGLLPDATLWQILCDNLAEGSQLLLLSDACNGGGMLGEQMNAALQAQSTTPGAHGLLASPAPQPLGSILLMSPVQQKEKAKPGFTGAVASGIQAVSGRHYRDISEALRSAWPDIRFLPWPPAESKKILETVPFRPFP